jgi:hypothetical protein
MPLDVGLVSRHPAPVAVVAAALAATAVVFGFFRPQYHPKGEDSLVKVDWSLYPPASSGWNWAGGQPGFRFGEHEEKWNFSEVQAAELAPARAAARRWGVAPPSVRLIGANASRPARPEHDRGWDKRRRRDLHRFRHAERAGGVLLPAPPRLTIWVRPRNAALVAIRRRPETSRLASRRRARRCHPRRGRSAT